LLEKSFSVKQFAPLLKVLLQQEGKNSALAIRHAYNSPASFEVP